MRGKQKKVKFMTLCSDDSHSYNELIYEQIKKTQ